MGLGLLDVAAALCLSLVRLSHSEHILSCKPSLIGSCREHSICDAATNRCECEEGFQRERVEADCVAAAQPEGGGGGHAAELAIALLCTVALICAGLFLVIRKYRLLDYIRQKINTRRNNDVTYEDVMIGHDDPPLTP